MERVLVGVDGSRASHHALLWAADLVARASLEMTAVRVIEPSAADVSPAELGAVRQLLGRQLEEWCAPFEARCVRRQIEVAEGEPVEVLPDLARRWRADLLVVGSRGAGDVLGLRLGRVARHLGATAPTALAVVGPAAMVTTTRLVISHDRRAGGGTALAFVATLAHQLSVPVTAVAASGRYPHEALDPYPRGWREAAVAEVLEWAAPIEAEGSPVDVCVDHRRSVDLRGAIEQVLHDRRGSVAVVGRQRAEDERADDVVPPLLRNRHHAVILVPAPARAVVDDRASARRHDVRP